MFRELWDSKLGFILASAGSAVGLANIIRFPFLVGKNGGAVFILLYLISLIIIAFPVFITEIVIGRNTNRNPYGAFKKIGKNKFWKCSGILLILIGILTASFYSALAGWILGYLLESINGNFSTFQNISDSINHYNGLLQSPYWASIFHALFLCICVGILYSGVKKGLERFNKILMPLLFIMLLTLVFVGLSMPNSFKGVEFLLKVDWSYATPPVCLLALSQAFFTLSAGQGTMITYGSYLPKSVNIIYSSFPIVLVDTLISILAAVVVFTIVFSVGVEPNAGLGLIFHTLPLVFGKISGGYFLGIIFFLLVLISALTTEVSMLEPVISYFIDEKKFKRQRAVIVTALLAFIIGLPAALSYSLLRNFTINSNAIILSYDFIVVAVLLPLAAFLAVILVSWNWGIKNFLIELSFGSKKFLNNNKWLLIYLKICIKYIVPFILILIVIEKFL